MENLLRQLIFRGSSCLPSKQAQKVQTSFISWKTNTKVEDSLVITYPV